MLMPDRLPALTFVRVLAIGFVLGVPGLPGKARAQSQGDPRALDSLGPTRSVHKPAAPHHRTPRHTRNTSPQTAPAKAVAAAPSPTVPAAPPPPPILKAPVVNVPLHPEPPPPPVPVVAAAIGEVSPLDAGSRISFGSGSADLNATTMQALQAFAAQIKADPEARAQIDAYSNGTADDPSTPRRMSLARGLAARAVLINGGVPSTRIYVRAIGQPHDASPADRVDVTRSDTSQHPPDTATGKAAIAP